MTFDRDTFAAELNRTVSDHLEEAGTARHAAGVQQLITDYLQRNAGFVRPRVLYAAAAAYADGSDPNSREDGDAVDALRRLAIATEILHVFALLHDDRIDGETSREDQRRGADRVLAGDVLYAIGFGLLSETVISVGLPGRIVEIVRQTAAATVVGQAADISFGFANPSIDSLLELYDMKTGRYTFVAPLQIGALWAGCPAADVDRLYHVGVPLGRAYQLRDDLVDLGHLLQPAEQPVHGRTGTTGRPDGSFPPWEWNLATAWARGHTRRKEPSTEGPLRIGPGDYAEIARFVGETVRQLLGRAERAAETLALSPAQKSRLVSELQRIYGNVPTDG